MTSTTSKPTETPAGSTAAQAPVPAHPLGLFPTLDSLDAVVNLGLSQLPITTPNALVCLLMTYHNTLLKVQANQ